MVKLNVDRLKDAEYVRKQHRASIPVGVAFSEVILPAFWGHVADKFTKGDTIEAVAEDGAFYALLYVRDCSRVHAQVAVLLVKEFHEKVAGKKRDNDPDFDITFKGPQRKWSIIRKVDKEYIKDGFATPEEAGEWLDSNRAEITK